MPEDPSARYPSRYGELEIGPWENSGVASVARYTWRPPPERAAEFPASFALPLDALVGADGVRRFAPAAAETFLAHASVGGLAVLSEKHRLTPEERNSYRIRSYVHRQARGFREHLDRRFSRAMHLCVEGGASVLPCGVGLDGRGRGEEWSMAELRASGRRAGASTVEESIVLGLTEAARLDPHDPGELGPAGCAAIVRMALFDFGPADRRLDRVRSEEVRRRLLEAIERHDHLDGPAFRRWLFGEVDNVVHAVAKRSARGVGVSRPEVRTELLELAVEAHTSLADCVQAQMRAFASSLPERLGDAERIHFAGLFGKRDYLGGLSLLLVRDRSAWLRPALLDLLEDPADLRRQGVVLRMLEYGSMVRDRRAGDAAAKSRGLAKNDKNMPALTYDSDELLGEDKGADGAVDAENKRKQRPVERSIGTLAKVAASLRESRGLSCTCGTTQHWFAELESVADPVVIRDTCAACHHEVSVSVPHAEFQRLYSS